MVPYGTAFLGRAVDPVPFAAVAVVMGYEVLLLVAGAVGVAGGVATLAVVRADG